MAVFLYFLYLPGIYEKKNKVEIIIPNLVSF